MHKPRNLCISNKQNFKIITQLFTIFSSGVGTVGALSIAFNTLSQSLIGLASAHPAIATITAIATALGVAAVAYDHFHVSAKESAKALSNMQSEYDGNKSELESLNSELETTQRRMDELQAKGHLTLTEQDELTKLQAQNSELERTIALKEAQQKIDAKKLASQAQDTYEKYTSQTDLFNRNLGDTSYSKNSVQEYRNNLSSMPMGYGSQDRIDAIKKNATQSWWRGNVNEGASLDYINIKENADNINYLIGAYETLQDAQKNVAGELDIIAAKGYNATEEELNQATALQEYYDEVEQKTLDVQDAMNNYADVISDTYNAYKEAESLGVITAKQSEQLKSMESFMTEYMKTITNTAGDTETAINNLFAESRFINLKDQLVSAGKVSEDVLAGVIAKTSGLPEALDKAGISAQQLSDYIMAIADPDSLRIDVIKDWLRDQFTKEKYEIHFKAGETADVILSDLFKDKTDGEIEIFYKYVFSNNLDMSGWTKEDLKANWTKAIEENDLTVEVPVTPTFSSLFKDADGNDTEFSKNIDTFQSNISSIQDALNSLKDGEQIDLTDLVRQFPELAGQTDNLSESLSSLKYDKLKEFADTWQSEISKITDSDQLKTANQFFNNLLSDIDLSNLDIKLSEISSNLLSKVTSTLERSEISNTLNKVWTEFGDTVEGREIIAKLSLNTDVANWTYEEWVEQIESEEIKADLRLSEESIADLQKQLEMKQSEASVTQSEIDLKNAAGYRTTEEDYKSLIENGKEQISIQDDIIKKRKKEQDNIKKVAQSTEQATAKYNELQKEIDSATATLNDVYKSQIEWNTALDNLPITNAQSLSSAISSAMSEIDSSTGLTVDTIAALKEQFSELTNIDIEDALYRTADGLKIDTNELERFTEAQNDAVMSQFESKIEAQRKAIEIYKATIGDNTTDSKLIKMQDDLESLLNRQAQYFAEYKNQMEQFTDYEDVQRAKNTENAGSHYDAMLSELKTAKEAYDNGLIGTDDFKSVAKYISPNGFDDFTNFAENYSKASRYLTEDSSGVINFLNDLQTKGYAAYQTLDDGSNQWIINIQDFADAAKDIGIGTDFFTDMFGKLEDYNIPNTFVSSVTEGELKIDDLTKQLVDAKVKLAELKAEGADTAVIDSQQRVVDELSTNLTNTQQSMNMFVESTKQNYVEGFSQVKDVISQLNDFRKNAQSEEEAQGYLNKIQEYADKYHLKLTADFEVDEASYQEQMDKMYVKSGSFENPIDPGFEKGSADAENYRSVLESVTKAHSENNKVLDESIKTLSKYDTETLKGINLNDGQYSVGLEDAERALDSLAQELGLTEEQAQMLATVLGSLGQTRGEVNVDYVDVTKAIDNLEQMQELGKIDETIDFTVDLSELDSNELESYLEKLKDVQVKLELDPDTEEYDYIVQRIQDTEIQMIIKETLENGSTVEELLNMSDEDLAKTCNIDLNDDGASERLEAIKENLQEVNNGADVPITIRMDDTQFNQLLSDKNNDTATITVDADNEPAKEKIDEAKDYADDQTGTMNIDGDKTLAINEADSAVGEINRKTATISIDGNLGLLSRKLTEELSKTRTINVSARVSGLPKAGEALGTAHASGTAVLDMWSGYRHSIGAYANGTSQNWALPRDEEALVNETGEPESIVRDGRWFLIPGGAHVEQLKKGDIIFNHKYKL